MMKEKQIDICIEEAERFIKRANDLKRRLKNDDYAFLGSAEGGALKRASMDLTRELATMRSTKR